MQSFRGQTRGATGDKPEQMANEYLLQWESSAIQSYRVSKCRLTIFTSMVQQTVEESFAVEIGVQSTCFLLGRHHTIHSVKTVLMV